MRVGDVVHELRRHQRFHDADNRHAHRIRRNQLQSLPGQGHIRDQQLREGFRKLAHIAHVRHAPIRQHRNKRDDDHRYQRSRNRGEHAGQEHHNRNTQSDQRIHQPGHIDEMLELRSENEDTQRVNKANHDRARNETLQLSDTQRRKSNLQHTREQHRWNEVIHPVRPRQRRDDERNRTSGSSNHGRATTRKGNHDGHNHRAKQPHRRVHARQDGKRNDLGDQRERHRSTGQQLGAQALR